jgi:Protein of unknown function (DUF3572)
MPPQNPVNRASAEAIALRALGFLTSDEERLARFLDVSGLRPETVRGAAASPDFLAGVLDYIVSDDALIVDFAAEAALEPERVMAAKHALSPVLE